MKVLFSYSIYEQNPCNDFGWFYSFKFNDAKREYGINDPTEFKHICRVLDDLENRLIREESIDQIIVYAERYIDDDCDHEFYEFVICRDDYEIDEQDCEVLHVDWRDDLAEFIKQKVLEVSGASSIK